MTHRHHLVSSFEILFPAFNAANSKRCLFRGVSAFTLLFSWWNSCSIGFKSGDWLGQSKTYHFVALINSLTEVPGCFGSLSWCNMKHFPMNLLAFSWILIGKMVLYPSKLILLLSSYIKSSVKMRGPVPEAAMHAHAMTPPPPCFTDEAVCLGSFAVPFFSNFHSFYDLSVVNYYCLLFSQSQLPHLHRGLSVSSSNARFRMQK